jgi:hypothetical protein
MLVVTLVLLLLAGRGQSDPLPLPAVTAATDTETNKNTNTDADTTPGPVADTPLCVGLPYPGLAATSACDSVEQPGPYSSTACLCNNTGTAPKSFNLTMLNNIVPNSNAIAFAYVASQGSTVSVNTGLCVCVLSVYGVFSKHECACQ